MDEQILKSVLILCDVLTPAGREAVIRRLREDLPRESLVGFNGDLPNYVVSLMSGGRQRTTSEIVGLVRHRFPEATQKQVYNALGYLTRHKHLKRIRHGCYEAA